jgi:hypothetical protein
VCLGCNEPKVLVEYVPIRIRPGAYYPRCRTCRNKAARERYHSTPEIRQAEIERARRNQRHRRHASALARVRDRQPSADEILQAVSEVTGIERSVIVGGIHQLYSPADARAVAARLLRTQAGLSAVEIGELLGRSSEMARNANGRSRTRTRRTELVVQVRRLLGSRKERLADGPVHPKAASGLLYGLRTAREAAGMTRNELGARVGMRARRSAE